MSFALALYTDGSARPNPGYAGWGVHGYYYKNEKPIKGAGHKTHLLTSLGYRSKLDGSAKENEVTPIRYYDISGSIPPLATNNTAELKAAIEALKIGLRERPEVEKVTIYSDSKMVVEGTKNWIKKWKTNNWKKNDGNPVGSQELWKEIDQLKNNLESLGVRVELEWVKGHGDNPGNMQADKLAVIGTLRSSRGEAKTQADTKPVEGYWSTEVNKNPLLDFRGLFFNTLKGYNTPGLYYLSNKDKEDEIIGSSQADTAYGVVRLKEPNEVIEYIRNKQSFVAGNGERDLLVLGKLSTLFNGVVYNDILEYGDSVLETNGNKWDFIHVTNKEPVTRILNPPKIAMRAVENISYLAATLEDYENNSENLCVTDVTHFFYDTVSVKKGKEETITHKLKDEYIVGFAKKDFDVNYKVNDTVKSTKLILTFGVDIINRNALKRIEKEDPVIHIVTWTESDMMIRYATVIKTKDDISIWSATHSNLKLIIS